MRSANSATLQGLLRALDEAISRLSSPIRLSEYLAAGKTVEPRAKKIAFHICVLNPGVTASIHSVLDYVPGKPRHDFFAIDVEATRDSLEIAEGRGWDVFRGASPAARETATAARSGVFAAQASGVALKSTSFVSTVSAVRPGAVW